MITFLAEPFAFPFMLRALAAAVLTGAVCGLVGVYVVLRGMAFFGDALAHSVLPGVAVGYLVGRGSRTVVFGWALGSAAVAALAMGALARRARLKEDTAIGIVFVSMFALGIALISTARGYAVDLAHFLFGNVLGVSPMQLQMIAVLSGIVVLALLVFRNGFLVTAFDPVLAQTLRLPVRALHNLLLLLLAATVVVCLQSVGIALTLAMLVLPPSTGYLLARRVPGVMVVSVGAGVLAGVCGLYLSYYARIAAGPAVVLVGVGLFLLSLVVSPRRGALFTR
ncbi:MAG: Manganese ABC transporter, inner membrane permease protein SitD [Candidatus Bipolaricaulis sibiricus]|uniref:Manganese ABC transporter, inner membrane permease protein SitD n=1 Tax=Bipolaricaulis sibiricus TaxID=2501609 RepID=A0A410FS60_BIPS1|nr:MAG: Manganese ABC transporter, inner membrane permease protein SitD [Candidatus Bipolaricaulis sibiricus]